MMLDADLGTILHAEPGRARSWISAEGVLMVDDGARKRACDSSSLSPNDEEGRKGRILLVDDDEAVRETLTELLEVVGFCVVQAADAAEALKILRHDGAIDVLVTDLTMPGDDGIALIRQAREIKRDLPAILLTGYAEQMTSVATIAGGNFHVLRKPVESDLLVEQLVLLMAKPTV
jgi:CheY-like chemotaxis protein